MVVAEQAGLPRIEFAAAFDRADQHAATAADFTAYLIGPLLARFNSLYPGLTLSVEEMTQVEAAQIIDTQGLQALLQTHPVTLARISDAKARARVLEERQANKPRLSTIDKATWEKSTAPVLFVKDPTALVGTTGKVAKDSVGDTYALMRERVRVLSGDAQRLAFGAAGIRRPRLVQRLGASSSLKGLSPRSDCMPLCRGYSAVVWVITRWPSSLAM